MGEGKKRYYYLRRGTEGSTIGMLFSYQAIDLNGRVKKGIYDASSEEEVISFLKENNYLPVQIKAYAHKRGLRNILFRPHKRLKTGQVYLFTKELGNLLRAGVPLNKALQVIAATSEGIVKELVQEIQKDIEAGYAFSEALQKRGHFSKMYVNLVKAGEVSGALDEVLNQLSIYLERVQAIQGQIRSAMIYPTILLSLGLISAFLILVLVIPKFGVIFEDLGQNMPFLTRVLLALSHFTKKAFWGFPFILVGLFYFIKYTLKRPSVKQRLERWFLNLPGLKTLILLEEWGRFSRTVCILLRGGLPLPRALDLAKEVFRIDILRGHIVDSIEAVKRGQTLGSKLAQLPFVPSILIQLSRLGEETGDMAASMEHVANELEERLQDRIRVSLSFLEPGLIIFIGLLLGSMIVSMLLTIFSLNEISF